MRGMWNLVLEKCLKPQSSNKSVFFVYRVNKQGNGTVHLEVFTLITVIAILFLFSILHWFLIGGYVVLDVLVLIPLLMWVNETNEWEPVILECLSDWVIECLKQMCL